MTAEYTSSYDLRDMIRDRDIVSLAEACRGNMWTTIRMVRILPHYMAELEIDEFIESVERAAVSLAVTEGVLH